MQSCPNNKTKTFLWTKFLHNNVSLLTFNDKLLLLPQFKLQLLLPQFKHKYTHNQMPNIAFYNKNRKKVLNKIQTEMQAFEIHITTKFPFFSVCGTCEITVFLENFLPL